MTGSVTLAWPQQGAKLNPSGTHWALAGKARAQSPRKARSAVERRGYERSSIGVLLRASRIRAGAAQILRDEGPRQHSMARARRRWTGMLDSFSLDLRPPDGA